MQTFLILFFTALGVLLLFMVLKGLRQLGRFLGQMGAEREDKPARQVAEGPITSDGLLYLFAHEFVKPAPRRPLGSVSRDRAFAVCKPDLELDTDDFAERLLYVALMELHTEGCLETRLVRRDPGYMPPYPHKQWELQLRQTRAFPSAPLCDSLGVSFDLCRKNRLRRKSEDELSVEDDFFTLEEVVERSLKTIRQEMSFWERGTVSSDIRNYVMTALIAQGFLLQPDKETWLDTVRGKRPQVNEGAAASVEHMVTALQRRIETFRKTHGSAHALTPQEDEKGQLVDIDPAVMNAREDLDQLPLDDCLRATIHETVVSIKQLEPSGEAGI
ncbi:MAG: hypothetical protein ABFE08_15005 [Armatimonadia bacterium]